jgi:hypothetical protein
MLIVLPGQGPMIQEVHKGTFRASKEPSKLEGAAE